MTRTYIHWTNAFYIRIQKPLVEAIVFQQCRIKCHFNLLYSAKKTRIYDQKVCNTLQRLSLPVFSILFTPRRFKPIAKRPMATATASLARQRLMPFLLNSSCKATLLLVVKVNTFHRTDGTWTKNSFKSPKWHLHSRGMVRSYSILIFFKFDTKTLFFRYETLQIANVYYYKSQNTNNSILTFL